MRVIIAGSRSFSDYKTLEKVCDQHIGSEDTIISGGANGADKLGEFYALRRDLSFERFTPDWHTYGRSAGHVRNSKMAETADMLIAFWDGFSSGTAGMIKTARKHNLKVIVVTKDKDKKTWQPQ